MEWKINKKIVFIFLLLVLTSLHTRCFALTDEIGDPTVPPSSTRSGLFETPRSSKTGFQGFVPYRSTSRFADPASPGSGLYLGRSAAATSTKLQPSAQPYYVPLGTKSSTTMAGEGSMLSYSNIRSNKPVSGYSAEKPMEMDRPSVRNSVKMLESSPLYDYSRTRPLSYDPADLERIITYDSIRQKNKKDLSDALQRAARGIYKADTEESSHSLLDDYQKEQLNQNTNLSLEPVKQTRRSEPFKPLQPGQTLTDKTKATTAGSVYEQMLQQVLETQQAQAQPEPQEEISENEESAESKPDELRSQLSYIDEDTIKAVTGIHKSFATEAQDKFNYYMRKAEELLDKGRYYRATDAYTLAGIYKPDDPLAFAGRSHALFASGEYMSSAYFLARAIDIFPQYVNFKIDLRAMIPDEERLDSRIEDVQQWIDKTNSPQLSFLLAYIHYQLGRIDLAIEAIQFAQDQMPDSTAVKALKQAIEKKL
ncbi:MAG: hypothetical protein JW806_01665 [Sedimentisphaerales bacterium]|nr:hypothetical protein [Sedimentisphaerales bacterium]